MLKKKIIYTVIIGLATSFVTPALSASAASVSTAASQTGWVQSGSNWYYYNNDGTKKTGWFKDTSGYYYYLDSNNGAMKTGWFQDTDSNWYYLDTKEGGPKGSMKTGWFQDTDGNFYHLSEKEGGPYGSMDTGWFKDTDGYWYYLSEKEGGPYGSMQTGWVTVDGKSYYLNPNEGGPKGSMLADTYTPDGYYVDASGAWDGNPATGSNSTAQALVTEAKKHIGKPYKWGATGPNTFDCSGFTQYVYSKVTGRDITRTTYTQVNQGSYVSKSNLQVGDLIFFNNTSSDGKNPSHVGMYIGNNEFIHASSSKGVTISSLSNSFYSEHYGTARRIL